MTDEFDYSASAKLSTSDEMEERISEEGLPVREVYGSAGNIEKHGIPSESTKAESIRYYFYPTWRSQLFPLISFLLLSVVCVVVNRMVPSLLIKGHLFTVGETSLFLYLPLLIFLPFAVLVRILMKIYDSKFTIDKDGVEAQIGLVSLNLRQPRLRWEDIRGVEPNQTLWERILGIGSVLIGSSMTNEVEIVMEGVANPRAIQLLIGAERDKRIQELKDSGGGNLVEKSRVMHID